jgi:hypothetical protein
MKDRTEAVYTLRIDRAQLDRLRKIADAEHHTLAQIFRVMVEQKIANHEASTKPQTKGTK